jgi:hypothetical protein
MKPKLLKNGRGILEKQIQNIVTCMGHYKRGLDWRLYLFTTYTICYYTWQITIARKLVFSVCYTLHQSFPGNGASSASMFITLTCID